MLLTADVVVIGAGVTGASITFHLAKAGIKAVCLEKNFVASGATGKSSAMVRMHYDNEPEIRMAFESLPYFQGWKDLVGEGDCGFVKTGCIRLVDPQDIVKLKNNVSFMQKLGINTRLISKEEIKEIAPTLFVDDIEIGAWEPESGYADPCGTTYGFISAAKKKGAELLCHTEVTGIKVESGRIKGVNTSEGFISTGIVINAAGAFASKIGEMIGIKLPVKPIRYQAGIFRRPPEIESYHPIVMDRISGQFYFRPEGHRRTLVGGLGAQKVVDPNNFYETTEPGYSDTASGILSKRIPGMDKAVFLGGRAGCDGISEDGYAIIGKVPEVEGFYCAIGHSGHGFKIAPVVGLCIAELITQGSTKSMDISSFRISRFAEGVVPFKNPNLYGERGQ